MLHGRVYFDQHFKNVKEEKTSFIKMQTSPDGEEKKSKSEVKCIFNQVALSQLQNKEGGGYFNLSRKTFGEKEHDFLKLRNRKLFVL